MKVPFWFTIPAILAALLSCQNNGYGLCAEVGPNAMIQRIGYSGTDAMLYISFLNSVSTCGDEPGYQSNRLDISLATFQGTYRSQRAERPETYPLPQGADMLFDGEITCNDSCTIPIFTTLSRVSVTYVRVGVWELKAAVDTNGQRAAEFSLWGF